MPSTRSAHSRGLFEPWPVLLPLDAGPVVEMGSTCGLWEAIALSAMEVTPPSETGSCFSGPLVSVEITVPFSLDRFSCTVGLALEDPRALPSGDAS